MNKIYVVNQLHNSYGHRTVKIFGALSSKENAERLADIEDRNRSTDDDYVEVDEFELDDPELLNRIAKESEKK